MSEGSFSYWISNLGAQITTDPITYIIMTHMMAWSIRKTMTAEEIDEFLKEMLRSTRRSILAEFAKATDGEVEDLQLPDREAFAVALDQQLKEADSRLRKLLLRNSDEVQRDDSV